MKRILILSAALALLAAASYSGLGQIEGPGDSAAASESQEASVTVRRLYEGPDPDFWGTCPSPTREEPPHPRRSISRIRCSAAPRASATRRAAFSSAWWICPYCTVRA